MNLPAASVRGIKIEFLNILEEGLFLRRGVPAASCEVYRRRIKSERESVKRIFLSVLCFWIFGLSVQAQGVFSEENQIEAGAPEEQYGRYLKQAVALEKKGKLFEAAQFYEQAYALNPEAYKLNLALGTAYFKLGLLKKAAPLMIRAIELNPDGLAPYLALGVIGRMETDYEQSIRYLKEGHEVDPGNFTVVFELANTYWIGLQDSKKAIEYLDKADKIRPRDVKVFNAYGKIYGSIRISQRLL